MLLSSWVDRSLRPCFRAFWVCVEKWDYWVGNSMFTLVRNPQGGVHVLGPTLI